MRVRRLLCTVLILALVAAACGGAPEQESEPAADASGAGEGNDSEAGDGEASDSEADGSEAAADELDLGTDEIVIGVTFPLSGPIGFIGQAAVNSMQVEVDRINEDGGLGGAQLRLEVRDDQLDPAQAVANVREFAGMDNLGLEVGSILSFMVQAVKPVLQQNEIVSCQPIVEVPDILDDAPHMFRNQDPDQFRLPRLLEHLGSEGIATLGLIYEDDPAGAALDQALQETASEYGIEYLGAQFFQIDDVTHASQVGNLHDADAIFLSSNPSTAGITALAAEEAGYDGLLTGFSGLHGFTFVEAAGESVLGTTFVANDLSYYTDVAPDEWAPAYREHVEAVVEEYGTIGGEQQPYEMYNGTVLGADCITLYAESVRKAGEFQGPAVAEAWETLDVPRDSMPSGVHAVFGPDDHEAFAPEDLWIYRWTQFDDGDYGLEVVDPAPNAE